MRYVLVDVDTQTAFASPTGNLSVYREGITNVVLDNIRSLVQKAEETRTPIIGSVDSHSYDAWEFAENGGPFPAHAVKGTPDWLKIPGTLPKRFRFVPMSDGKLEIGEKTPGTGNRTYGKEDFVKEALSGVGLYFEKEVYSAYSNPHAASYIEALVEAMGGKQNVIFVVIGFCTGMTPDGNFFCVGSFAKELAIRGFKVQVVSEATASLGSDDTVKTSILKLQEAGVEWIEKLENVKL